MHEPWRHVPGTRQGTGRQAGRRFSETGKRALRWAMICLVTLLSGNGLVWQEAAAQDNVNVMSFRNSTGTAIAEGTQIVVEVRRSGTCSGDISVDFEVEETGKMLAMESNLFPSLFLREIDCFFDFWSLDIDTADDNVDEPDSTVTVTILPSFGLEWSLGSTTVHTRTVTDNDPTPVVTLVLSKSEIAERGTTEMTTTTVTATLSNPSSQETTVTVAIPADATGDASLSANAVLTIPALKTASEGVVTLTAVDDGVYEGDEEVEITGRASNSHGITNPQPVTVTIKDANTPPTSADETVETSENTPYTFSADDFAFVDNNPNQSLSSVRVIAPPGRGVLRVSGEAVTRNATITKAQIDARELVYTPVSFTSGDPYTTFTFKVSDGEDESTATYTMTIDVTAAAVQGEPADADVDWKARVIVGHWHVGGREWERGWRKHACVQTVALSVDPFIEDHSPNDICFGRLSTQEFQVGAQTYTLEGVFHSVAYNNDSLTIAFTQSVPIAPLLDRVFVIKGRSYAVRDRSVPQADTGQTRQIVWGEPSWTSDHGWPVGATLWIGLLSTTVPATPTVTVSRTTSIEIHGAFPVRFSFSRDVTGFEQEDIVVENGTVEEGSFEKVNDRTWTATIVPTATGTVRVAVGGNAAQASGTGNTASQVLAVDADLSFPTATLRTTATEPVSSIFPVEIEFSKTVSEFTVDDVEIEGGEAAGFKWLDGGSRYLVQVNPRAAQVRITVRNGVAEDRATRGNVGTKTLEVASTRMMGQETDDAGEQPAALTAEMRQAPDTHDGSSEFEFKLLFSENVPMSYRTIEEHLFRVTNGEVTRARRDRGPDMVPGEPNRRWIVTAKPSGTDTVMIVLPPTRDCADAGAVCSADGSRKLENGLAHAIPIAPLTAEFRQVPSEHDGSSEFTFEVRFSEDVRGLSFRTLEDEATFTLTNGVVKNVERVEAGKNRRWKIRVKPSGWEDTSVVLPATTDCSAAGAICTLDGRMLANESSKKVLGPPALSVADASVREGAGARLAFQVSLSRTRTEATSVEYATSDGTAVAGEDYVRASGTLTFAPGETRKTIEVEVLADAHDDDGETMTLTLSNASGAPIADSEAIGTIENTGPIPQAWTVRFGALIGGQLVEALTARLATGDGWQATIGGLSFGAGGYGRRSQPDDGRSLELPEWDERTRLDAAGRTMTREELLLGSRFHLSTGGGESGEAELTAWGQVATGGFDAEQDGLTLDGEVTTGVLGADAKWGQLLAGVMLSQSRGEGGYQAVAGPGSDGDGDEGKVESSLTGVYPYLEARLNERVSAWGLVGVGAGELTLRRENEVLETELGMRMGALGLSGRVLDGSGPSGIGLDLGSDAMWVETTSKQTQGLTESEGEMSRVRVIVQGERPFAMESGALVTPTAELGLRIDGGDAETGAGLELGGGLRYARGPLSIEGQLRGLIAHEESGYEEWGASGVIRISPGESGRGLTFTLAPVWGNPGSQANRLWGARDATALEPGGEFEAKARLETEVGYGFGVPGALGVVTPYTGLSLGEGEGRTVRAGARWQLAPGAVMGLEGTRRAGTDGAPGTSAVEFRTELRW